MKYKYLLATLMYASASAQIISPGGGGGGGGGGSALPSGCSDAGGGILQCAGFTATGAATNTAKEIAAPGAASASGEHNYYFDSTTGRLYTHRNGATNALPVAYTFSHATDCTSVTVLDTGISLITGDFCHEADADTTYQWDGTAWDQLGNSDPVVLMEIGRPVGASSNTYSGLFPQGMVSTTVSISSGTYSMTDADTELFYFDAGIIPSTADMSSVNIEIAFEGGGTGTSNFEHEVTMSCLAMGGSTRVPLQVTTSGSTDFDELTYVPSDPSLAATVVTAGTSTNFGPVSGSLTGVDYTVESSGCGAGDLLAIKVARDGDDAPTDNTNIFWMKITADRL